jgi:hypothetical protein
MAKRTTTRKKAARSARKKAKTSGSIQKSTKKTRNLTSTTGKASKKKTPRKRAVTGKKSKKTAAATANKNAARKTTVKKATKRKAPAKAAQKKAAKKKVAGKAAKKKVTKKKGAQKKPTKKAAAATTEPETPAVEPEQQEPGLPLKEVRARLGLIGPQIADLDWLEGLYLYGPALLEMPRLEHVDFIVVYRGRRGAKRLKAAESELRTLLEAVLPLDFELNTGTLEVGRLLGEGNPAAMAHLGYAEPVFTRSV